MTFCQESPSATDSLVAAAVKVLREGNPWKKAEYGRIAAQLWKCRQISLPYYDAPSVVEAAREEAPNRPARDSTVQVLPARSLGRRGKGGSLASRQALLHSLVHIESWAVDLSWDIIARFGKQEHMPIEFFDDFVQVAEDEGRHFNLLAARLQEVGSHYGALPGHDGLWESAEETSSSLRARLAVEHCVHEARGLDILPQTIARFRKGGDVESANLLETMIYPEEITHCRAGVRWFTYLYKRDLWQGGGPQIQPMQSQEELEHEINLLQIGSDSNEAERANKRATSERKAGSLGTHDCHKIRECKDTLYKGVEGGREVDSLDDEGHLHHLYDNLMCKEHEQGLVDLFHFVVKLHFRGPLKPPFNFEAREQAGFGPKWYFPLVGDSSQS